MGLNNQRDEAQPRQLGSPVLWHRPSTAAVVLQHQNGGAAALYRSGRRGDDSVDTLAVNVVERQFSELDPWHAEGLPAAVAPLARIHSAQPRVHGDGC